MPRPRRGSASPLRSCRSEPWAAIGSRPIKHAWGGSPKRARARLASCPRTKTEEDTMAYTTATTNLESGAALPHNAKAAATWSLGGRDYDNISFGVSDALAHAARRLAPQPGERVLDVATVVLNWSKAAIAAALKADGFQTPHSNRARRTGSKAVGRRGRPVGCRMRSPAGCGGRNPQPEHRGPPVGRRCGPRRRPRATARGGRWRHRPERRLCPRSASYPCAIVISLSNFRLTWLNSRWERTAARLPACSWRWRPGL